ncbi:Peptidyl-prolyl cis-trans isomerase, cyclophilin-type [Metarhizium album ARSEF 1941]|uniref:Peptidyl-prolyl cis-trans isomerase-like 2 n=1 Tax=Metarhizium album (strain ARSEF 1941) TaxID=1081103 RepID=A0A0B2WX90_METAS|nr:Peptidyl-prolyl cis-trans isomerase, cyclophilin-type [Metarhizium album ARSEF 1941]KHO00857.1 Peptidyl-prolyl cis-trans isomerase, cyclophilin-type [Metarhizium album ARSEF 1941]
MPITHSEWSSSDAYSASAGAKSSPLNASGAAPFRRLPFNYCAASLQPFKNPVCTPDGTIFDVEVIGAWLEKHPNQNPVNGEPLHKKDLIRLNFARNASSEPLSSGPSGDAKGDLIDPVTYKVLTDNTHIVAIRHGTYANAFAWETVERMNIKPKLWQDLVDDQPFGRADIITLQDPRNAASRNLEQFKYLKDGQGAQLTKEQEEEQRNASGINASALGSMGDKVLKAKAAVEKARKAREAGGDVNRSSGALANPSAAAAASTGQSTATAASQRVVTKDKKLAANAAAYTTGKAAASFTSTGLTPETSGERALLTDEEFMLRPRRVKAKGYARMETNLGDLTVELHTDTAPRAVWNFIRLAQTGYYKGVAFHRNMANFMIQGGDPSGTGKGGSSIWGKYFNDEFDGPLTHNSRGILSMANKGKNTNSSQFFITYKATPHLDRKHTIFGLVVDGKDVLSKMEAVQTDGSHRPLNKIFIKDIVVFVDPFAEFQTQRKEQERLEREREEVRRRGGTDDDRTTWTGKRIRGDGTVVSAEAKDSVGKYLNKSAVSSMASDGAGAIDSTTGGWEEPVRKKTKGNGGFGNFDSW